jgi:phospholipid/cholesterol/gamma-HCH transport system substrate-binding protein
MASRKELQWSQLRVGILVLIAMAVLIGLIFLMSGSTGGLFARKLTLRSYFSNASGLKDGAPVTLEGVTVGNVLHVRIVPERTPTPVEVSMQVGAEYLPGLHTSSTAAIAQAGVLGDSFIDLSSAHATGPPPANNAELLTSATPSIQDVVGTSQTGIQDLDKVVRKLEVTIDAINSGKGTVGMLINDPQLAKKVTLIANDLQTITSALASGKGTMGKLLNDDTLYKHADSTVSHLDSLVTSIDEGKGSVGKLVHEDEFYKNLNATVSNANTLIGEINAGHGALGKFSHDPDFAKKLDETVTNLDSLLKSMNEGKGTLGQLVVNKSLYDHADQTMDQTTQLLKGFRENPKKYLTINMKIF